MSAKGINLVRLDEWQTVQLFINDSGVTSVEIRPRDMTLRCGCRQFRTRKKCRHSQFVVKRLTPDRVYHADVLPNSPPYDKSENMRDYLLRHGKIVEL